MPVEGDHAAAVLFLAGRGDPSTRTDERGDEKKTTKLATAEAPATETAKCKLWNTDTVTQIDCNVDDCTGEELAFVVELLLSNRLSSSPPPGSSAIHAVANSENSSVGQVVVDAWITPIVGKKGRPAHILSVLCREENRSSYDNGTNNDEDSIDVVLELIFRHTTTLGIRIHRGIERVKLRREIKKVHVAAETDGDGTEAQIGVKIGKFSTGEVVNMKAEYEDCRAVSLKTGIPIKSLAEDAVRNAR